MLLYITKKRLVFKGCHYNYFMAYAGIVLERRGKYLLQLRDDKAPTNPNKWSLFGGGIEKNETPINCIIREIQEELGVLLDKDKLNFLIKIKYSNDDCYIYRTKFNYSLKDLKLNEGADMKFFSKEEIMKLENLVKGIRELFLLI